MVITQIVVEELRQLFRNGATPSRLIQHIRLRHPTETAEWRALVQAYFWEAFSVPLVRVSNSPAQFDAPGLNHAHFNRHLIHRMIQTRPQWDARSADSRSWLDSLVATDDDELTRLANPEAAPDLAKSWQHLDPAAQRYILQLIGNVNGLHQRVVILAQLAEHLQRQVEDAQRDTCEGGFDGIVGSG